MRGESPADENECREKQWGPHSEATHRGRDRKEEVGGSSSKAGKSQVTEAGEISPEGKSCHWAVCWEGGSNGDTQLHGGCCRPGTRTYLFPLER